MINRNILIQLPFLYWKEYAFDVNAPISPYGINNVTTKINYKYIQVCMKKFNYIITPLVNSPQL